MIESTEKSSDDELDQDEDHDHPGWTTVVGFACATPDGRVIRRAMELPNGWLLQTMQTNFTGDVNMTPEPGSSVALQPSISDSEIVSIDSDVTDIADEVAIENGFWVMSAYFVMVLPLEDGRRVSYEVSAQGGVWAGTATLVPPRSEKRAEVGETPQFDISPEAMEVRTFRSLREAFELCESGWVPGVQ